MWESRVAPLSGVAVAVLLIGGFLISPNTEFMPAIGEVADYLEGQPVRIMTAGYVGLLAAAALTWFSASLYRSLRRLDDDSGRLALVAFGGGVFASAMVALGQAALIAAAERVWVHGAAESAPAVALSDLAAVAVGNAAAVGLGVLIAAAGIAVLRTGEHRRWLGWSSVVLGLGLVSPYGWAVLALGLAWVAAAGVWIYRTDSPSVSEQGVLV